MKNVFTPKRRRISTAVDASHIGDLRFSAKTITGTGVVEPIAGLLYCNGAAISRATYKRLFDQIGTAFGVGDGSTTFNLPDFRGRFLAGATDGATGTVISGLVRGGILGAEAIALAKANVPPHTHGPGTYSINGGSHQHGATNMYASTSVEQSNDFAWWRGSGGVRPWTGGSISANTHSHGIDAGTNIGDGSADGLAATGHQNVHPHTAFGGVLVTY